MSAIFQHTKRSNYTVQNIYFSCLIEIFRLLYSRHTYPVQSGTTVRMQSTDENSQYTFPLDLLQSQRTTRICAPMVRYSKLAFRTLVRQYDCDLAFSPMIMANSFVRSKRARDSEFTTNKGDRPLIVQFAANNSRDLADAAEIVAPYSDGIDINCGCPQRWAAQEGVGACLINKPELLTDMVRQIRLRVPDPQFTVSIKMRIHHDIKKTVDLCKKVETAGVSWIAVHGRTREQRSDPVNYEAIKLVKENVTIPVIANGDVCDVEDITKVCDLTGVNGVMVARGLLQNPAMFSGYRYTPHQCVENWVDVTLSLGTPFQIFHHHLIEMLDHVLPRPEKRTFNCLSSTVAVLDFLQDRYLGQITCR